MEGSVNYRQALTKAMAMCSQSERCRSDVVLKLKLWELSGEEIDAIIQYLVKERFLDEERYVHFYINDKLRFNHWGKVKLAFMLRQKQIPEELIRTALIRIDEALYEKTLFSLLKVKVKSVRGTSDFERKGKLAVFAQSHGFEGELSYKIADQLINDEK
jgi:regulatory protein